MSGYLRILLTVTTCFAAGGSLQSYPVRAEQDPCGPIIATGLDCKSQLVDLFTSTTNGILHVRSAPVLLPVDRITVGCCVSSDIPAKDLFLVRVLNVGDAIEPEESAQSGSSCAVSLIGSFRDISVMAANPESSNEFTSFVGLTDVPAPLLEVRGLGLDPENTDLGERGLCGAEGDSPNWHSPAPEEAWKDPDSAFSDWQRAGHPYVLHVRSGGVLE